jgi:hypothetical protein
VRNRLLKSRGAPPELVRAVSTSALRSAAMQCAQFAEPPSSIAKTHAVVGSDIDDGASARRAARRASY